jgi:hypothetical protein
MGHEDPGPFDDASDIDGEHLYANRTVLMCRTRWGKVVRQEDFYEDTVLWP